MNRIFGGVMGSGVRHFGLYAVFDSLEWSFANIEAKLRGSSLEVILQAM
jgi:hypothetical protein